MEPAEDITGLLTSWSSGDQQALGQLMTLVYPEIRNIARRHLNRRSGEQTLQSAALANEAYLRLVRARGIRCENRVHFLALCAQIVRRILVDHARSRGYAKRGGSAVQVSLDEAVISSAQPGIEVVALDEALRRLSDFDSRKSRVVEMRYFGGLSIEETAGALGISPETARRDWKMAKSWLLRELSASSARARIGRD